MSLDDINWKTGVQCKTARSRIRIIFGSYEPNETFYHKPQIGEVYPLPEGDCRITEIDTNGYPPENGHSRYPIIYVSLSPKRNIQSGSS